MGAGQVLERGQGREPHPPLIVILSTEISWAGGDNSASIALSSKTQHPFPPSGPLPRQDRGCNPSCRARPPSCARRPDRSAGATAPLHPTLPRPARASARGTRVRSRSGPGFPRLAGVSAPPSRQPGPRRASPREPRAPPEPKPLGAGAREPHFCVRAPRVRTLAVPARHPNLSLGAPK